MKRIIFLIFIILLITGCKEKETTDITVDQVETKEIQGITIIEEVGMKNVFSSTRLNFSSGGGFFTLYDCDKCFILNGRIYFGVSAWKPEIRQGYYSVFLNSYDFNGENEKSVLINPINDDADIKFMWYDSEYNLITIEEHEYVYTLAKFDEFGELIFSIELNEITDNKEIVSMVIGGEEDNIYIATPDKIIVFSNDSKLIWQTAIDFTALQLSSAHGKTPILKMREPNNTARYQYIDVQNKKLTNIEMPHQSSDFFIQSYIMYGEGNDYYYIHTNGVYGYDIASNTLTKALDWNNSDLIFSQMRMFAVISPKKMFIGESDLSDYKDKTYLLNYIHDNQLPDKKYISIGYIYPFDDDYLNKAVSDFNKYNDEYRLTLTNFYPRDGVSTEYHLRLNNAIAAGNAPDILYINSMIPMLAYTKNGLFDNINDYLADAPVLSANLLPFVTESAEINGVLPQIITKFRINTLMGKTKNFANKTRWSIKDMLELHKSLPDDVTLTYELTRNFLTTYVLDNIVSKCVDYINGICDFDVQGFRDYIELYELLPEYFSTAGVGDLTAFRKDNYAKCRNDEMVVGAMSRISNVLTYTHEKILNFRDEDVTVIGFPTMDGNTSGDYIEANGFAILNTSKNKDGAWEFIKHCLSDEFTTRSSSLFVMLPTKSSLRIYNDWYEGQYVYFPDNRLTAESIANIDFDYEAAYGTGILERINDAWIGEFNSYLETIDNYVYRDKDIVNIINDELSAYVNTTKSIDDTIKAIQSRVSIYMSEMWG